MPTIDELLNLVLQPTQTTDSSGLTQAALQNFANFSVPVLANEAQLLGLRDSPAFLDVVGRSLSRTLPQFIQADVQDQRAGQQLASTLLGQQTDAAGLSASIANQQRQRQIEASLGAGNLLTQFASNVSLPSAAQQTQTAFTGLEGLASIGQQQTGVQQAQFDAAEAERARLQGLAQTAAFGPLGDQGISQFIGQTRTGK